MCVYTHARLLYLYNSTSAWYILLKHWRSHAPISSTRQPIATTFFLSHALIHNYYIYIIVLMYEYAHAQLLYLYNSLSACVRARTHVQLLYLYNSLSTWYDLQLISILSRYDLRSRSREASSIVATQLDRRSYYLFSKRKQLVKWAELIRSISLCARLRECERLIY